MRPRTWRARSAMNRPCHRSRTAPWDHHRQRERNCIARPCRWLNRFRRIATRYDKLEVMFRSFIYLALTDDGVQLAWTGPTGHWQVVARHP